MTEIDALDFDPWYSARRPNDVPPSTFTRETLQRLLSFRLARGIGDELKIESKVTNWRSTRITCRLKGKLYRIVQYPLDAVEEPETGQPGMKYSGRRLFVENEPALTEDVAVWWLDSKLAYVEVASRTLSAKDLLLIARHVIDQADRR